MNLKIYHELINRAKERKLLGYVERHHIIPRCLGGSDEPSNLVKLTAREHYIAHLLLSRAYPKHYGLALASFRMGGKLVRGSRQYEQSKIKFANLNSVKFKELHADPEYKVKHKVACTRSANKPEVAEKRNRGVRAARGTDASRAKTVAASLRISNDPDMKQRVAARFTLLWQDPSFQAKMAASPTRGNYKKVEYQGVVFNSIGDAMTFAGLKYKKIRPMLKIIE